MNTTPRDIADFDAEDDDIREPEQSTDNRRFRWHEVVDTYWSYGMLCDPDIMVERYDAELLGVGVLQGYQWEIFLHANVRPNPNAKTFGCLWKLHDPPTVLRELDATEGVAYGYYRRKLLPIVCRGKTYKSNVYIMTPDSREDSFDRRPNLGYVRMIKRGYDHAGVPVEQLWNGLRDCKDRLVELGKLMPDEPLFKPMQDNR